MYGEKDIAFPYKPPSAQLISRYKYIFQMKQPIKFPLTKRIFDVLISLILIIVTAPIFLLIIISYKIEGLIDRSCSGDIIFFYWAISQGKLIKKYKIRLVKTQCFIEPFASNNDWRGFTSEWVPENQTWTGKYVKKFYMDELPQFFSILKGDMSLIGPRPLAEIHYKRDVAQGNIVRRILRGGLLGLGHIKKGTMQMGEPIYEYEYADAIINKGALSILFFDITILYKGFLLIIKGGGH